MRATRRIVGFIAGSLLAAAASAHHSFAAFDLGKTTEIEGVLTEVRLVNPHSWLEVEVASADGKPVRWAIDGLVVNPLRTGEPVGSLVSVTLADGTVLLGGPGQ